MCVMLRLVFYSILLLACLSPAVALNPEREAVKEALAGLRFAIGQRDVAAVRHILRAGQLTHEVGRRAPTPLFWVANERGDSEELGSIAQLLLEYFGESNQDFGRYHPLTRAVHRHNVYVLAALARWPDLIPEVFAEHMSCEDIAWLPLGVAVVVSTESADCFRSAKQIVQQENSRLLAAKRLLEEQERSAKAFQWSNPFLKPPPGKKPPHHHLVMNPRAFEDFSEATIYYFFGEWTPAAAIAFQAIVITFWLFTCFLFTLGGTR